MCVSHPQLALLYCDNKSTLQIAANPTFHECTKHTEIDCQLVRKKLHVGLIKLLRVPFSAQLVDICTRPLATAPFQDILHKLGLVNVYYSAYGEILENIEKNGAKITESVLVN